MDGDTIDIMPRVDGRERVRLIRVATPEVGQPYAQEAGAFTSERLQGLRVALEFDVELIDSYNRLLAYVYLPDGTMFNEALVWTGYAQVATFSPTLIRLAPGARIPPRLTRFFIIVRKALSNLVRGSESRVCRTRSSERSNDSIRFASCVAPFGSSRIVCQTAARCSSNSTIVTRSASSSKATVRETMPPPANGSTNSDGRGVRLSSHWRILGTSHVLPPGYRNGLLCGTEATLTIL